MHSTMSDEAFVLETVRKPVSGGRIWSKPVRTGRPVTYSSSVSSAITAVVVIVRTVSNCGLLPPHDCSEAAATTPAALLFNA